MSAAGGPDAGRGGAVASPHAPRGNPETASGRPIRVRTSICTGVVAGSCRRRGAVRHGLDDIARKVRRSPVIDGSELVGVSALADVAKALDQPFGWMRRS
jgi:hypothetical protein